MSLLKEANMKMVKMAVLTIVGSTCEMHYGMVASCNIADVVKKDINILSIIKFVWRRRWVQMRNGQDTTIFSH